MNYIHHPLTVAELADYNRQRTVGATCCTGDCAQGRQCVLRAPAEACTELGADAAPRAIRRFWSLYIAALLVAAIAGAASLAGCNANRAVSSAASPTVVLVDCTAWRDCA